MSLVILNHCSVGVCGFRTWGGVLFLSLVILNHCSGGVCGFRTWGGVCAFVIGHPVFIEVVAWVGFRTFGGVCVFVILCLCHCSGGMCGFQDLERVHSVLKIVFMMFPNYCLGRGLIELAFNEYKNEFYFKTGETLCADPRLHSSMEKP